MKVFYSYFKYYIYFLLENMGYLEALEHENSRRQQRRSRRKSSTRSMADQTADGNIFDDSADDETDSEDYQDFQVI
jgi:hypothetical protein